MHKQATTLRLVLSIFKILEKYFQIIEGANIETNTEMAREILQKTQLDTDEIIISLVVKS